MHLLLVSQESLKVCNMCVSTDSWHISTYLKDLAVAALAQETFDREVLPAKWRAGVLQAGDGLRAYARSH